MSETSQIENLLIEGAQRILARATDCYAVNLESLVPRVRVAVEKYVLRDDEGATTKSVVDFIEGVQADDLCLIIACERGDQTAWKDLVERFSGTVRSAARAASSNEEAAEDLAQSIWAELYGLRARADGKPAGKLAYYSGRGSLAGWLRAVVAQLAVDQHRKQLRLVQTENDADFDRHASDEREGGENFISTKGLDPEQAVSNKFAAVHMEEALATSMKELSDEDRLLVKLYYFDGLRLREVGAVLGVHEATASRRLTRIHGELRDNVERALIQRHGWTKAETESSFAELALNLETDLEPILAGEVALGDSGSGRRKRSG